MENICKKPPFLNSVPQPMQISAMREHVIQFPQVLENVLNQTAHKKAENKEIFNEVSHMVNDFERKLLRITTEDEELVVVQQLRMNLERLTKENMKLKTQQLALQEPLDLTKSSNEKKSFQLLGRDTPNLSPIRTEMPASASATTLTPGLSQTLNRLVEIPLQPQLQQGGSTQSTTTTVQKCAVKRAQPAQSSPSSHNESSDTVVDQQLKKIKVKEIVPVDMNVIKERLNERTIVVDGTEFVVIGANNNRVPRKFLLELNWNNTGAAITRKLLSRIFDHKTLATHTLTGKPSPAFLKMNKPEKGQLDQLIVQDIIEFMTIMTDMSAKDVKTSITTKCADECKKLRRSLSKIALAPPEANVAIKQEPMFAVSAARKVISVPEVTSTDAYERNVVMQPEVVSSDLTERDVINDPQVTSSDLTERNVITQIEAVSLEPSEKNVIMESEFIAL